MKCIVSGCERDILVKIRGLCSLHYKRWQRYGDPEGGGRLQTKRSPGELCEVPECEAEAVILKFCNRHYLRNLRYGSPTGGGRDRYRTPEETFNEFTMFEPNTGCLLWLAGTTTTYGYGIISDGNGGQETAHRYAWTREFGAPRKGSHIDHICHTPACVNTEHLREVTPAQNVRNRSGLDRNNTSGYRNVSWSIQKERWRVTLKKDGKTYSFGTYEDIEEAAKVAKKARKDLFGEFAGNG